MLTNSLSQYRQWRRLQPKSLTQICQRIDAEYHIPRPASAQHLPAYQAALHLLNICGQAILLIVSGFLSAWLLWKSALWLALSIEIEIVAHCLGITAVLISWIEAAQLWLPYYNYHQRVTYGSARWADVQTLRDLNLARRKDEPLPPFTLLLGGFGKKNNVVLGPEHSTCHLAMFGPPRSGKSSTFFITWQRAWASTGSVIVLDPKGELYDQTAYLFRNVYRIDLQKPERTDRWNFLPACKNNAEYAHKVAAMILDSEQSRRSTADPFWKEAEKAALTAILLQLNQLHTRPAPHMIQELISTLSLQQLNDQMMKSPDPKVPLYWGMFSKVEPKLQAGVLIGLGVACADFSTPNMMAISSPITNPMAARGVRFVDFTELRQPGTAIFMIVPEGDAERYKRVLSTFFGLANDCLRNGELTEDSAPVLFNLDEIGNIHIPDLPAALGVGRGRRMTYALGYQNIAQLYHQYGTDGGDAVLGSVGAMVFLPGVDQRTAEYASRRLGATTVLQASLTDVRKGNKFDSERATEVGRPLMDAGEIRQMTKYKQAIAIISNAPPLRLTYPKFARDENPPLSERERCFQRADNLELQITPVNDESTEPSITQALTMWPETEKPPKQPSSKPKKFRWEAARAMASSKPSAQQELRFEPEYDPASLDEEQTPLFDFGSREGR
ncbi:MAG: type IV secretory system conjugative DNA transfer family protein [Blastocatellales bacterium]